MSGPGEEGSASEALAAAGWEEVAARVLGSSCHDLNGGAAVLEGVAELLDQNDPLRDGAEAIRAHIQGVQTVVATMALLRDDPEGPAEPGLARDLVREALVLHRAHHGTGKGTVRGDFDLPPIRVGWARARRALAIVLHAASRGPGREGPAIVLDADDSTVTFAVSAPGGTGWLPERTREALTRVLARDGGWVDEDARGRIVLRVPAVVRRTAGPS